MYVTPLSYKLGACKILVNNFSAKNKQTFEFGLVQPGAALTESNQGKARAACRDSLAVIKPTSDSEQFRGEVSKPV